MARALSAGPAFIPNRDADLLEIENWYRGFIADARPPAGLKWEPVKIGPTWQFDADAETWDLPEFTLGWGFLAWCGYWLRHRGKPWKFTPEQARIALWYYAVNCEGDPLARIYRLQRLKGHGKDPIASTVAAGSLHAPVIFDHFEDGRAIGRDDPEAWTQIIAVSQDQTKNTMKLFPSLISPEAQRHYGIQIGKTTIWSDGDRRQIEAVTNSVLAIEGGRPRQIIRAETQNWVSGNGGHDMNAAIEGNAAKAELGTPARILDIFNAFIPGRDSVAERSRLNYDELVAADPEAPRRIGVIWDSLEAPPDAPLTAKDAPDVLLAVRGDSTWLDIRPSGTVVQSILDPDNSPSESRRKWYNQITGTEDAWVDPRWADANVDKERWLQPGDRIVMFGDGSKSGDDTGLIAVRLEDGFAQTLHWQHPKAGELVDRAALDAAVVEAFDTYKPAAFYFDPSHAKSGDAVEEDRFWWPLVDEWHRRYSRRLNKKFWPIKGANGHSVAFDMTKAANQAVFQPAVTQLAEDLAAKAKDPAAEGAPHHGGKQLVLHMKAAKRREGKFGVSIGKDSRSSPRKVDLAVCFVGARMLWRLVRLSTSNSSGKGRVIVLD